MATALITGASSGIGREFARIYARNRDNLVIIARRKDTLNRLKKELEKQYNISVTIIDADLSQQSAPQYIYDTITSKNITIDYLINNAGFGRYGEFADRKTSDMSMIEVNITSPTKLTKLFLNSWIQRGYGKILFVGSIAGFVPGPLQSTYYASKAYINSFSQALWKETQGTGVSVTLLCPGPVQTEFSRIAGTQTSSIFGKGISAYQSALIGYNAMQKGKRIVFDNTLARIIITMIVPFVPPRLILHLAMRKK